MRTEIDRGSQRLQGDMKAQGFTQKEIASHKSKA